LIAKVNDAAEFEFVPNRDRNGKVKQSLHLVMKRKAGGRRLTRSRWRWGPSKGGVHHRRNNIAFTFGPLLAELGGPNRNNFLCDH
jgi:hypothetical protein